MHDKDKSDSDLHASRACLTAHVLDASTGRPASDIEIELQRQNHGGTTSIRKMTTNADGRLPEPFLRGGQPETQPGRYVLRFATGNGFFGIVPVEFEISNTDWHHHVPLVISPFGFSTYRGAPPRHAPTDRVAAPLDTPYIPTQAAPPPGSVGAGLTVHVIDAALGCGAGGLLVELYDPDGNKINSLRATAEGRTPEWLVAPGGLQTGQYELRFHLGDYYRARNLPVGPAPFFPVARVPFTVSDTTEHYHIPLLASPWGYSSYRGS